MQMQSGHVWDNIFTFLDVPSIKCMSMVCRHFNTLAKIEWNQRTLFELVRGKCGHLVWPVVLWPKYFNIVTASDKTEIEQPCDDLLLHAACEANDVEFIKRVLLADRSPKCKTTCKKIISLAFRTNRPDVMHELHGRCTYKKYQYRNPKNLQKMIFLAKNGYIPLIRFYKYAHKFNLDDHTILTACRHPNLKLHETYKKYYILLRELCAALSHTDNTLAIENQIRSFGIYEFGHHAFSYLTYSGYDVKSVICEYGSYQKIQSLLCDSYTVDRQCYLKYILKNNRLSNTEKIECAKIIMANELDTRIALEMDFVHHGCPLLLRLFLSNVPYQKRRLFQPPYLPMDALFAQIYFDLHINQNYSLPCEYYVYYPDNVIPIGLYTSNEISDLFAYLMYVNRDDAAQALLTQFASNDFVEFCIVKTFSICGPSNAIIGLLCKLFNTSIEFLQKHIARAQVKNTKARLLKWRWGYKDKHGKHHTGFNLTQHAIHADLILASLYM